MRALLIAALLFAAPLATAQVNFGLKGGLNVSNFSGDDAGAQNNEGFDTKLGAAVGATVLLDVTPSIGVGVEALYSQKGGRIDDLDRTISFDYVEIPAYVRLAVPLAEFLEGGLQLGGYAGIPVRTSVSDIAGTEIDGNTDFGVMVGVDVGSGPYYAEARYSQGLADITESGTVFSAEDPDVQNQVVTLSFGVRF